MRLIVENQTATFGTGRAKMVNSVFASVLILSCRLHFVLVVKL